MQYVTSMRKWAKFINATLLYYTIMMASLRLRKQEVLLLIDNASSHQLDEASESLTFFKKKNSFKQNEALFYDIYLY